MGDPPKIAPDDLARIARHAGGAALQEMTRVCRGWRDVLTTHSDVPRLRLLFGAERQSHRIVRDLGGQVWPHGVADYLFRHAEDVGDLEWVCDQLVGVAVAAPPNLRVPLDIREALAALRGRPWPYWICHIFCVTCEQRWQAGLWRWLLRQLGALAAPGADQRAALLPHVWPPYIVAQMLDCTACADDVADACAVFGITAGDLVWLGAVPEGVWPHGVYLNSLLTAVAARGDVELFDRWDAVYDLGAPGIRVGMHDAFGRAVFVGKLPCAEWLLRRCGPPRGRAAAWLVAAVATNPVNRKLSNTVEIVTWLLDAIPALAASDFGAEELAELRLQGDRECIRLLEARLGLALPNP